MAMKIKQESNTKVVSCGDFRIENAADYNVLIIIHMHIISISTSILQLSTVEVNAQKACICSTHESRFENSC